MIVEFAALVVGAALLLNVLVADRVGLWLVRPLRHVPMMRVERRWYDYALRAGLVAILVGVLVTFSFRIGPYASGLLAVFPVVLTSIILILHNRAGGKPTAAVHGQCGARTERLRHSPASRCITPPSCSASGRGCAASRSPSRSATA